MPAHEFREETFVARRPKKVRIKIFIDLCGERSLAVVYEKSFYNPSQN